MSSVMDELKDVLRRREDPNQGKATTEESNSLSGMISTLIPALIIAVVFFALFLILRRRERHQYAPRTYLGTLPEQERTPQMPNGLLNWFGAFYKIPDTYILNHHSLDAYLFLRYLRVAVTICFVGCLITWPVLFPINIVRGKGLKQLDMLSFGNVANKNRYYAHALVSWAFFGFVVFMITRECIYYINLRQAYLLSPLYAKRLSSRTVLFTSVPEPYLDQAKLRQILGPTLVQRIWIATDCKDVEELVEERDKVAMKLEGAETKLVRQANAARLKAEKNGTATGTGTTDVNGAASAESGALASRWLPDKKRPTHKLTPLIGKKVDTIHWCRAELERLLPQVEAAQGKHRAGEAKAVNSVFVEFVSQSAAQEAYQTLTHHQPLHMAPRYIGIRPGDVFWKNLRIKWWERIIRLIATTAFIVVMIIFWAIPVSIVGAISNINYLQEKVSFLEFIDKIPKSILGLVTGFLPAVLLSILMALVPVILRLMARLGGSPSRQHAELTVQHTYFAFQVVQVFLVTTFSSAASAAVVSIINNPSSATSLLATSLPKASNFYIAYFLLQGLSVSAGGLLQLVPLILHKVLSRFLDSTPRKIYRRWAKLKGLGWGYIFPIFTNFVVIAITYSCIAPLILGFATLGIYLFYFAYRYNLLFVFNADIDTKGLIYPRALQQTLTGVYLAEVCMIGLFALGKAPGPLILEVVALVFTVLYHFCLNRAMAPLLTSLPRTLATEEQSLMALEDGQRGGDGYGEKVVGGSHNGMASEKAMRVLDGPNSSPAAQKKPNPLLKFFRPDKYSDYHTLRRLVPAASDFNDIRYGEEVERNAYYHPAIASPTPVLWIPRDEGGVSQQEVRHTSKVIPMTDEGAGLNEKNKIVMNEGERPPIHDEPTYW